MTAPWFVNLPRPLVDGQTLRDLIDEANYLSRMLGQPQVHTPGAAGILNCVAPSTVWVIGDVDVDELARWCRERHRTINQAARAAFASFKLREYHEGTSNKLLQPMPGVRVNRRGGSGPLA